jgi:AcrR family transcriptional regulator
MSQAAKQAVRQGGRGAGVGKRAKSMPRGERRKQLLSVAKKIIADGGIGALTMSKIALQAGVSKPVVYEHFPNSESVAIALLNDYFEQIVELVDSSTKNAETLSEYLSIAIDAQFKFHDSDTLSIRGITNGHSSSEELNKTYHQMRRITLNTFQELLLQQGVAQPAAKAGGLLLAELMASGVLEFATWRNNVTAKETLKRMMIGAIDSIAPAAGAKPTTPAKALARSRRLKRLHES